MHLLIIQPWGTASPVSLYEARKPFVFKASHPVLHGSRRVTQQLRNLASRHPLGHQQNPVQPMIVPRLLGPPDLILERKYDGGSI